ncbi:MAG TPA: SUMF1/EgtB/PvdO family nonheme iron enzyme [Tenuifilaceae bacterium]|jgi:formylglycine-generating enzyme required for sulfatase activity|nr:SUMF1/EgtB/PvdO family nonheme iron enzyme [Bacteroidales bacterium]MDI9516103.1 SUMF1/EgtB/PvdO family nonheme iron enzyme [Bacteroidota bacterium]NLH57535.1 SUMF1/EgtB/PvdO family nonheme iron enzyme [Rikenellaceae bacterium]OQC63499.1 MAG: Serine/threonine-protein kinase pkn1 [Bacteroidetes bacterium ADurb.Bin008]HNV81316.1 SUMF1/EgtB/PvdO family nonheme iron enzyme [Tenuifilaceae bacterium]
MKKLLVLAVIVVTLAGCGSTQRGELTGVPGRKGYQDPTPLNMVFVPMGSFNMGSNDQDVSWAINSPTRTVSVDAFWMDQTEITNNQYRQFVFYVRDSIARRLLGQQIDDFQIEEDEFGNPIDPPVLNWDIPIDMRDEEQNEILNEMYYTKDERFYYRKEIDTRKLNYEFFWIDLKQAAQKRNRWNFEIGSYEENAEVINNMGVPVKVTSRSSFIIRDKVNVYPDTLCWISDFSYSFNEPYTTHYFWHPSYDNYPVVGVSWRQAYAFTIWRTQYLNKYLTRRGISFISDYRLPTEAEWEYAARGGLDHSMYPWGNPYIRNAEGCILANYKPLRGNLVDDGGFITLPVGTYSPNDYGLYDMAGNVAEWTANAYDESAYTFMHDMNPDYKYNAKPNDPPALKRKVVRGGSWKDIGYFLQVGTRTYEYQDTTKSHIGFRCVRTYSGAK